MENTNRNAQIVRHEDGSYQLGAARFDTLNELMEFDPSGKLVDAGDPYAIGYHLGGLAVQLQEGQVDKAKILQGLQDSTDSAWTDAVLALGTLLQQVERGN